MDWLLTIKQDSESSMIPPDIVLSLLAFIVVPVDVMSVIMSAEPISGAISKVPLEGTIEKFEMLFEIRKCSVSLGNLLAILRFNPLRLKSVATSARSAIEETSNHDSGTPKANEQAPKPKLFNKI